MTLIEVTAALAILATVLVGILLARAKILHQQAAIQLKTQALHAADDLLATWWAQDASIPAQAEGDYPGDPPLHWSTATVHNPPINQLDARVVRLSIFQHISSAAGQPLDQAPTLLIVDLVVSNQSSIPGDKS